MSERNLWGDALAYEDIQTPYTILREQAALLGQGTNQLLEGIVKTQRTVPQSYHFLIGDALQLSSSDKVEIFLESSFYCRFDIIAPALDSYAYTLIRLIQPIEIYPTIIIGSYGTEPEVQICKDEEEFIDLLSAILSSDNTKRVISGLLSQVKATA